MALSGRVFAADAKKKEAGSKEEPKKSGAVVAADHKKGRDLYQTRGCPTCHGSEAQWKSGFKVTFPNTKALIGYSNAVKAEAVKELDEPGYIEHFVTGVLKQSKGLTPEEDKVMKTGSRNPQGVNLMLGMIKGFFTPLNGEKEADIKAIAEYIRAYRKSPEAFK